MPRMLAASRGASSFCTSHLPADRIAQVESLFQYAFVCFVMRPSVRLVSKGFAGFQCMCDALLRFLFAAERHESFTLQIQHILFADYLRRSERSASQNIGQLARNRC